VIIVIEGSDLTGKTTLIKSLQKKYPDSIDFRFDDIPVNLKTNKLTGTITSYADKMIYKLMAKLPEKIFFVDRFILSELIYSDYLKRIPGENIDDIKNKNIVIFILHCSIPTLKKRFNERNDKFFSLIDIININQLFFIFYNKNNKSIKNIFLLANNNEQQKQIALKFISNKITELINK